MDYQSIATFIMEMAGTVAFAASGAMVGVERNMDIFGVSVLGVATAVGGGMIRDIVLGEQNEELYEPTNNAEIAFAFREAGEVSGT